MANTVIPDNTKPPSIHFRTLALVELVCDTIFSLLLLRFAVRAFDSLDAVSTQCKKLPQFRIAIGNPRVACRRKTRKSHIANARYTEIVLSGAEEQSLVPDISEVLLHFVG